ncbi:MAG: sensor histidine kinase [Lachnospiraceae bacterium]|nr:sensor histidine kinase [Lachnospiraceae bacterium]
MDNFLYSKKGKGIAAIIQNIMVVIVTVCVTIMVLFSSLSVRGIYGTYRYGLNVFDNSNTFEDTDLCYYLLSDSIDEIVRYAVIREQMETKGIFDGSKQVDIEAYAKRYQYGRHQSGVYYHLEDLIKWGQYGLTYNTVNTSADNAAEDESTSKTELVERYYPVGGKPLASYVTDGGSYEDLCQYLSDTIDSLSYNYYQYRQFQNLYKVENTNMRYYIVTNGGGARSVYTNLPPETEEEQAKKEIRSLGKYVTYDAGKLSFDTNTNFQEEELTSMLNSYEYAYSDNYLIFIGLDTNYPANDSFSVGKENFYTIIPWMEPLMIITAMSTLVIFLCIVYRTLVAGKKSRENEIILTWFDGVNTEWSAIIACFVCGSVACITMMVTSWFYYSQLNKSSIIISVTIGVFLFHALFMYFYLSLVRRIKNKSLLSNSIVFRIYCFIIKYIKLFFKVLKKIFYDMNDNGKVSTRTWIPYIGFLIVNFLLLVFLGRAGIVIAGVFDICIGKYLYDVNKSKQKIVDGVETIKNGDMNCQITTVGMHGDTLEMANAVNTLGEAVRTAVETSMKDERLKTDLITNVSHDIKTPLTSIINYVDLIKRENVQDEKIRSYVAILDAKSQRLKHLTDDLVEASKISSGNITLQLVRMNFVELLYQTTGEFTENFNNKGLRIVMDVPNHPVVIQADSRRMWRVIENLFRNIEKYAMENTRIYIDMTEEKEEEGTFVHLSIKNISKQPLNINAEDLTERFIRGDISRSTEGSGLGLSIAKNLTQLQNGTFEIYLDGDLFKVMLIFPEVLN